MKALSLIRYTLLLATVLFMAACSKDDPEAETPKLKTIKVTSIFLTGKGGRPGSPDIGIPDEKGKLEAISFFTKDRFYRYDLTSSGNEKITFSKIVGKDVSFVKDIRPEQQTQWFYKLSGFKGALFVGANSDSTFYEFEEEIEVRALSNEQDANDLLETALNGLTVKFVP